MQHTAAIIDLGTNTFHLLVFTWNDHAHQVLHKLQLPVKLGRGGFASGSIARDAYARGIDALMTFQQLLEQYAVERVKVYGTAALRQAANAKAFVAEAESIVGEPVHIVSGEEEAELIYKGVRWAVPLGQEPTLIMDIGGGSIEFVIADERHIYWKKSYSHGIARLLDHFHLSDPMLAEEQQGVSEYLEKEFQMLWVKAAKYQVKTLVGASGSFETLAAIDMEMYHSAPQQLPFVHYIIQMDHFETIYEKVLTSTREQVTNIPGMIAFRAEMFPLAMIMIRLVVQKLGFRKVVASDYALKEGAMYLMMRDAGRFQPNLP